MPPSRSYTLGGGGYGDNSVPALHEPETSPGFLPYPGSERASEGSAYSGLEVPASPRGPRDPVTYEDSPPMYDDGMRGGASHVVSGKR